MRTLENLTVLESDYSRSRVSWSNYTKINSYPSIALYHHFDFTRVLHTRLGCYLLQKLEAAVSRHQPHHRLLRRKYHYKQVLGITQHKSRADSFSSRHQFILTPYLVAACGRRTQRRRG